MRLKIQGPKHGEVIGTTIETTDGTPIKGVVAVRLVGRAGDPWRAELDLVQPEFEVTALTDESRVFVAGPSGREPLIDCLRRYAAILGMDLVARTTEHA